MEKAERIILCFMVPLIFIAMYLGGAWALSPTHFTFRVEMDNNTRVAFESINYALLQVALQQKCFDGREGTGVISAECYLKCKNLEPKLTPADPRGIYRNVENGEIVRGAEVV